MRHPKNIKRNKTIAVIGSRPNTRLPDADAYYFANSAIALSKELPETDAKVILVVSANELNPKYLSESFPDKNLYEQKREAILETPCHEAIILAPEKHPDREGLHSAFCSASNVRFVTILERQTLLRRYCGSIVIEIIVKAGSHFPFLVKTLLKKHLFALRERNRSQKLDLPRDFRSSTGVTALLLAISEHGRDAKYVICGVSMTSRKRIGEHARYRTQSATLEPHLLADRVALKRLSKKTDLFTDDQSVVQLCSRIGAWRHFLPYRKDES